jgi:hypothetical protein
MRPGQQNKRGRGRSGSNSNGGGNRKGQNPLSRSLRQLRSRCEESAEPPSTWRRKYMNLARDAQSSGDRVMAENYLQHAEHYNRIILTAQAQMQERIQRDDNSAASPAILKTRIRTTMIAIRMPTNGANGGQEPAWRPQRAAGPVRTPVTPGQVRTPGTWRPDRAQGSQRTAGTAIASACSGSSRTQADGF